MNVSCGAMTYEIVASWLRNDALPNVGALVDPPNVWFTFVAVSLSRGDVTLILFARSVGVFTTAAAPQTPIASQSVML